MRTPNRILILTRYAAQDWVDDMPDGKAASPPIPPTETWALLSIVDRRRGQPDSLLSEGDRLHFRSRRIPLLECCFGDIVPLSRGPAEAAASLPAHLLFSEIEAKRILAFLDAIRESTQNLIIHCGSGVSRSGAVGLFACRKFGLDEREFLADNPRISPNPWVLQLLCETAGLQAEDLEYWYRSWQRNRGI